MTEQSTTPDPAPADEMASLLRQADASERAANSFYVDARAALRERDAVRAELARVRPVVDAAREAAETWDRGEWGTGPRGTEVMQKLASTVETADILTDPDTVAAIAEGAATSTDEMRWSPADGDAAATPQPAEPEAGNVDVGALGALIDTLALDVYAAAHGCEASEVNAGDDGLGDVRQVLADAAPGLHAARATRSSAPPADAPAGLRAAAKVLDEGDVYLGVTREANALRRLADTIEADPSGATSQAIVRALATPTTDTES